MKESIIILSRERDLFLNELKKRVTPDELEAIYKVLDRPIIDDRNIDLPLKPLGESQYSFLDSEERNHKPITKGFMREVPFKGEIVCLHRSIDIIIGEDPVCSDCGSKLILHRIEPDAKLVSKIKEFDEELEKIKILTGSPEEE